MDELKLCPFCGGQAEIVVGCYDSWTDGYAVMCCNCCLVFGAHGRLCEPYEWTCIYESEAEAIKAWNTRYERTVKLGESDRCPDCKKLVGTGENYCAWCGAKVIKE